jgi:gamma-glutamyl-gamma-aminobutyrate hydrolase PuuD
MSGQRRPRIAISSGRADVLVAAGTLPSYYLGEGYPRAVAAAGGVPLILPCVPGQEDELGAVSLDGMDGLLLAGGTDIHPESYGQACDSALTHDPDPVRDRFELALVGAARERSLPVLGVCRGFQILNVAYGGSLCQHRPHQGARVLDSPGLRIEETDVRLDPSSRLAAVLGAASTRVCCIHHQAIDEVGPGLRVVGQASDGTVEAIEDASGAEVLGVLWHPEQMLDSEGSRSLYGAFVAQAGAR